MKNFTYKTTKKIKHLGIILVRNMQDLYFLKKAPESHEEIWKKWWDIFKSEIGSLNSFKMISVQILPIVGLFVFVKKTECKVYMEKI